MEHTAANGRGASADAVPARIDGMEGHAFERFIADLLQRLDCGNVQVTPGSGDPGVDVLAEWQGDRFAIQCKCRSSDLGNTPV